MGKNSKLLPLPPHYDPAHGADINYSVGDIVSLQRAAERWCSAQGLTSVGDDSPTIQLLVIDAQVDFSFPSGSLYVAGRSGSGAVDANTQLVEFIYRHLGQLSQITCTMDTHVPFQVFFPSAHLDESGNHPQPNTVISAEDYRKGRYRPNPAMARQLGFDPLWLQRQFTYYCEQLEASGKYQLYLWSYHCMLGSPGHRLAGIIEEARLFHAFARGAANLPETKGGNPLSERYSIFREEVSSCFDGRPISGASKNTRLLRTLLEADIVIIAGLASSHCVKESVSDLLGEILTLDPGLARKVYILRDCTAAVVIPDGADFTEEADLAFARFAADGMHIVESSTPLAEWPDIALWRQSRTKAPMSSN